MQCVILAGGLATRMRPYTEKIPKSLLPVGNHAFIHYQLAWLSRHGIDEVVLSIGYRGELIRDYVGNGSRWGLEVRYVDEGQDLRGTAGALRLALEQGVLKERFLVTYGDSYLPIDFARVWRSFQESELPALMTVFRNEGKWDSSNVCYAKGRVTLYDKALPDPRAAGMEYIDYGLSGLDRKVIEQRVPSGTRHDLAGLFHDLSLEGLLAGYEVGTRFYEIGSVSGLEDFKDYILQPRKGAPFPPGLEGERDSRPLDL